ncbi:MAG: tetratricopeptide repeat protein [Oscillospiraceae bacterium]|nr:tetratricopeptide repeat protein [Oscillospiraceae bacterium]
MKWLHISDLHYNPSNSNFDTRLLLSKLNEYVKDNIIVDEVIYTGDFRFAKEQDATEENARLAAEKLFEIANNAGVSDPRHIHIVPGNHDLERGDAALIDMAYRQYANGDFTGILTYNETELSCIDYLTGRFKFFEMVAAELSNQVWVDTSTDDHNKYHRIATVAGMFNVVYLNTAIGSGKNGERSNLLVGYEHIHNMFIAKDNNLPTIVLGHHGLGCFTRRERERIIEIFRQNNVLLYLCGDEHIGGIDEYGSMMQLTSGCLDQKETGVEPTFYTGEINQNGVPIITAYTYLNGAYPGWSKSDPMNEKIEDWIVKSFPSTATKILIRNDGTSISASSMIFGRENEINKIMDFLKAPQGKIVEVWGVAGIGKTTVCMEVLKRINKDHIIVDTRFSSTTLQIQRDILRQLGIDVEQSQVHPNNYAEILLHEAKKMNKLLYLDNAESPIFYDRSEFSKWLLDFAVKSGWRVFYTTQNQLEAANIESIPLEPISDDDDAKKMFVSRRGINSILEEMYDVDKKDIEEIAVDLLSKHPLAIVLSTSVRQNKRSLKSIINDLREQKLPELKDDHDNPHRSMKAALSMTISGILKTNEADKAIVLWSLIAQYPGIFSEDLYSVIFDEDQEWDEARQVLREYAILAEQDYTMLEPIKAVVSSFEEYSNEIANKMLFYTLATIFEKGAKVSSTNDAKWHDLSLRCLRPSLTLLNGDRYNRIEMVQTLVYSMQYYFQFSPESLNTLCRIMDKHNADLDKHSLALVQRLLGDLESSYGNKDVASRNYEQAEERFRSLDDKHGLANVLRSIGELESLYGDKGVAREYYEQAEELFRSLGDNLGRANVLRAMGDFERLYGDKDVAREYYEQAEELYRSRKDNLGLANVLLLLGELEKLYGDNNVAHEYYEQAEELFHSLGDNLGLANVLRSIGELERLYGDKDIAREYYEQAEELYRCRGDNLGLANVLLSIGELESLYGDNDVAREYYEQAEELYRYRGDNLGLANVLLSIGELEGLYGDKGVAREYYEQAEELYRSIEGDNLGLANVLRSIGKLEILHGDIDSAITFYEEALELYVILDVPIGSTRCYAELCYAYAKKADEHNFIKHAKETIASLDRVNSDFVEYAINLIRIAMEIIGYEGTIISL